jgi:STE24 endopeptidase
MQFIVFCAFAIVLGVPRDGPPWFAGLAESWPWLRSPFWMGSVVFGQIIVAAATGTIYAQLVRTKLEREAAWLPAAQRRMAQGSHACRLVLIAGFCASVLLTDWVAWVNGFPAVTRIWALDEVIVLTPFFLSILAAWISLYPADRAIRQVSLEHRLLAAAPARPVWRLGTYLTFMFRQHVLVIAGPMLPIVIANDMTMVYSRQIRDAVGLAWADQAALVLIAGMVFLVAPLMLRFIWPTRPMPTGELRTRLEGLCRRVGLSYRRILIWETDGMVVNAAVMGLVAPLRYILLSDGMLEMMDDRRIEAVFGHEAGHVKKRHIEFYLLFAVLSMLIVGGITLAVGEWLHQTAPKAWIASGQVNDYLQLSGMLLIILVWGFGFGVVSRRFEWQADLFGARCVTPQPDECNHPCVAHGTAGPSEAGRSAVCATAATLFADALHRIAVLNGIPIHARSWRHSSIAYRIELLKAYTSNPAASARLDRTVWIIKLILFVGTIIGLTIGVWLFWGERPVQRFMELMGWQ